MNKKKSSKKNFKAIETMRKIRDAVSKEIKNMTYEQEREYLDKLLANSSSK